MDENLEKKNEIKSQSKKSEVKPFFITLELDKLRELRFGFKAIKRLEQHFKVPVIKLYDFLQEKINDKTFTSDDLLELLWIGLLKNDPDLTKDKLEDILDDSSYSFTDLITTIADAFGTSMPEKDEESLKERVEEGAKKVDYQLPSRKHGTGKRSSKRR